MTPNCASQEELYGVAILLKELPRDDRVMIAGVIVGLGLARGTIPASDAHNLAQAK